MKKIVAIALFVFLVAVTAILIAGYLVNQTNKNNSLMANDANTNTSIPKTTGQTFNMTEIAKHNSAGDCWLLIRGKVYDVTDSISRHPGGAGTIIETCGTEATMSFDTKGQPRGDSHSTKAEKMLADYYIGDLIVTQN